MENLFEEIMEKCNHKKVVSLCKELAKKLSFRSGGDTENLCHLIYWLYILDEKGLAKKCMVLTHNVPFDGDYRVWDFINNIWGLEIRILRDENKNNEADSIVKLMERHDLSNDTEAGLRKLRNRFTFEKVARKKQIEDALADGDNKEANIWRFLALFGLIGNTETGFYPNLNNDKEKIEETIKNYVEEILK
jgi:hypothetical protein